MGVVFLLDDPSPSSAVLHEPGVDLSTNVGSPIDWPATPVSFLSCWSESQREESGVMSDVSTRRTSVHLAACASRDHFPREDGHQERLETQEVKKEQNIL